MLNSVTFVCRQTSKYRNAPAEREFPGARHSKDKFEMQNHYIPKTVRGFVPLFFNLDPSKFANGHALPVITDNRLQVVR
jgi:hypothetical protein